jgi:hypothetical protein
VLGALYFFAAIAAVGALVPSPARRTAASARERWTFRAQAVLLTLGTALLLRRSGLEFVASGFQVGQLLENTCQWFAPLGLLWSLVRGQPTPELRAALHVAVAFTFAGHGLIALGVHPVPELWVQMVERGFGCDKRLAMRLLWAFGSIDVWVAAGALASIRYPRLGLPVFVYAVLWGALTALARTWTNVNAPSFISDLERWAPETLFRLCHSLLPLMALAYLPARQVEPDRLIA